MCILGDSLARLVMLNQLTLIRQYQYQMLEIITVHAVCKGFHAVCNAMDECCKISFKGKARNAVIGICILFPSSISINCHEE